MDPDAQPQRSTPGRTQRARKSGRCPDPDCRDQAGQQYQGHQAGTISSDTEGIQVQFRGNLEGMPGKISSDAEGIQMEFRGYSGGIPMKFWVFRFWGHEKHNVFV